jgi:hypothetical protein
VADANGDTVDAGSPVYQHLVAAIDAARIPLQRVQVAGYQPLTFSVAAKLVVDPRTVRSDVHAAALAALSAAFSFARRAFGQPVTAAELMTLLQQVEGVTAVELTALAIDSGAFGAWPPPAVLSGPWPPPAVISGPWPPPFVLGPLAPPAAVPAMLPAHIARFQAGAVLPAELLLVNQSGIRLQESNP